MAWFKNIDVAPMSSLQITADGTTDAVKLSVHAEFVESNELEVIKTTIGELSPGNAVWFKTDGAWSSYNLLEYLLIISGPAIVYFTTWSISEVAITKFVEWKKRGILIDVYAVIDSGLRNRKPAIYHQAIAAFPNLKIAHCHAKATVIESATHNITVIGSANYTKNPRIEVGVLFWSKEISEANKKWILDEIGGTN